MRCCSEVDVLGSGERLVQDAAPAHLDGLLLQVADNGVLGEGDGARIGVLAPCDDIEQCGLPRPVGAHQGHPVASCHAHTHILEQDALAEGLGHVVEGEYHGRSA